MTIQAMKQALEALEDNGVPGMENVKSNLRAAIEAAEKVEPVARCIDAAAGEYECLQETNNGTFLYTHQQPAIPAGLEIQVIMDAVRCHGSRLNNDEILSMLAAAPKPENLR